MSSKKNEMLTVEELIKLVKGHNVLVSMKIKKNMTQEQLVKLIESKGYKVDHKNKKIVDGKKDRPRRPKVTLKEAEELTKSKPKKEQTAEQKEKKKMNERKKIVKFILENKDILNEPEVKKLHKGLK